MKRIAYNVSEAAWLELRAQDLTSTDVAALFNVSPYLTYFDLWHRKHDQATVPFQMNDRVKWGSRMEAVIATGIAEDQGWMVRPMKEYIRLDGLRLGSSFDFCILGGLDVPTEDAPIVVTADGTPYLFPVSLLEIKAVDWLQHKQKWIVHEDGEIEAPLHIELQVQHQMLVSGVPRAKLGVMIGGNQVQLLTREAIPDYQQMILQKAAAFWQSVDDHVEPSPDFPEDLDTVKRLYGYGDPGKYLEASDDAEIRALCEDYVAAAAAVKEAEALKDTAKGKLLMAIGECSKVTCGLFTISAGMVAEAEVAYTRAPYRNFRVTQRKPK